MPAARALCKSLSLRMRHPTARSPLTEVAQAQGIVTAEGSASRFNRPVATPGAPPETPRGKVADFCHLVATMIDTRQYRDLIHGAQMNTRGVRGEPGSDRLAGGHDLILDGSYAAWLWSPSPHVLA